MEVTYGLGRRVFLKDEPKFNFNSELKNFSL